MTDQAVLLTRASVFNGNNNLTSTLSYVGAMDPGTTTTITFGILVQNSAAVGLRSLTILIAYDDPYGLNYTTTREYNTYVYPTQPFLPTYDIVAIIVAVLVVVFGYVALRRLGYKPW